MYISRPNLTELNPHEYDQGLRYCPFTVNLNRFYWNCNTLDDLSNKSLIPNKTEDIKLSVFNTITRKMNQNIDKTYVMIWK